MYIGLWSYKPLRTRSNVPVYVVFNQKTKMVLIGVCIAIYIVFAHECIGWLSQGIAEKFLTIHLPSGG